MKQRLRPGAFTLVELLVVIGIIVVLLGLIIPVSRIVNEKRMGMRCVNNLRQLYTGTAAYMVDHRMEYPRHYLADPKKTHEGPWYLPLSARSAPYQIGDYSVVYLPHQGFGHKHEPYYCMKNEAFRTQGELAWTNYAMNFHLIGKKAGSHHGAKVLYMDSNYAAGTKKLWYLAHGPEHSEWKTFRPVHGRHSYFAFTDGRIEAVYVSASDEESPTPEIPAEWFSL